ncbi:MAG: AAA family ATPase [Rhodobacteraceae bacterium]|jgi:hypothetical protein|nr:AAA family ATPase [Paracoccaceae bacterium]
MKTTEKQQIATLLGFHGVSRNDNFSAAMALAMRGLPVFPAGPDKRPLVKDWQARATADPGAIRRWWRKWPDAMPALPMGRRSGLAVLDVDRKNGKDGMAALRKLGHDPAALSPVTIATPSGGLHAYFRWPEGMGNSPAGMPAGVDVRAAGGYVIAPGARGLKGRYRAKGDDLVDLLLVGPEMLPEWPEALRPRARSANDAPPAEPGQIAMKTLRAALLAVPNDGSNPDSDSRDWWLTIGAGLHYETGGSAEGLDLWLDWSARWPGHDPAAAEAAWQSFRRRDGALRTGATILAEAAKHGWTDTGRIFSLYDEPDDDLDAMAAALLGFDDKPAEPAAGGLTFLSPADCTTATARRYVVKGLVAAGDVAAIVGAPGVGKSLIAPRLGYAVAQGSPAFGLKVRQGGVLYVAAEDESGMRARVAALREEYGDAPDFALVGGVTSLFPDGDHKALRAAVKARRPALIVIDTLAMAFPGLRENEAESMGLVVAAARALTKWGAAVVLVHHDTKDGAQGLPRGHSILNGALDMSLHLTRDGNVVRGRPTKNRNGSADVDLAFTIATRVLGEDEDGDEIRAAFARDLQPGDVEPRTRFTKGESAVLAMLHELGNGEPVPEAELRAACIEGRRVSQSDIADNRRRSVENALKGLLAKGALHFAGGHYQRVNTRSQIAEKFADAGDGRT